MLKAGVYLAPSSYEAGFISFTHTNVVIDETSMELIQNSTIDYVHELIGSSFKITNPQASSSCGCGTSFSI